MRHGKKINHLGRKADHRKAMLSNMAASLILHKRISTTVAKAKALKKYIEPLLTKAKTDTTHSRRVVFSYLHHKDPVKELFTVVADKIANRPGGYTRILKTGNRFGDNAEMCIMELVDFNEKYSVKKGDKKGQKKRTRRGGVTAKKTGAEADVTSTPAETKPKKSKQKVDLPADGIAPTLTLNELIYNSPKVIVSGLVSDNVSLKSVLINDQPVNFYEDGTFKTELNIEIGSAGSNLYKGL